MSRDAGSIIGFRPKISISTRIQQTIVSAYIYFLFKVPFFNSENSLLHHATAGAAA
jgi:hypothetical protein